MRDPEEGPSAGQPLGRAVARRAGEQQGGLPVCALLSGLSHLPAQDPHFLDEEGQEGDERRGWTSRAKG